MARRIPIPAAPRLFEANQHLVATAGEDGAIAAYDVRTGKAAFSTAADGRDLLEGLAVSDDGERVAVVDPGVDVRIFDAATGKVVATWPADAPYARDVAFAGTDVLLVGDGEVQLRSATGAVRKAFAIEGWQWGEFLLAADDRGRFLLRGEAGPELWDARTGQRIRVLRGHRGRVGIAAFDPTGARLVTGSEDTTALVWDVGA